MNIKFTEHFTNELTARGFNMKEVPFNLKGINRARKCDNTINAIVYEGGETILEVEGKNGIWYEIGGIDYEIVED